MVVAVTDWECPVVGFVEHQQFAISRLVLHVYFVAKQHRTFCCQVTVPLKRAAQAEEFATTGVADVQHLARSAGELVHAELAGQVARRPMRGRAMAWSIAVAQRAQSTPSRSAPARAVHQRSFIPLRRINVRMWRFPIRPG